MSLNGAPKKSPPLGAGSVCSRADKWFRDADGAKYFWNGITYGPFKPNSRGEPWPENAQLWTDLAHIASLGFNVIRVYEPPSEEVLRACTSSGLRLLAGVPWTQHVDFLADRSVRRDAIARVTHAARRLANEPCIAGLLVGNEIDKALVRWMGPARAQAFLETLIAAAKVEAPNMPVAYANYPSTEYLAPRNADFIACNVFLESRDDFARYVRHLQIIAGDRPLVITEFGLDTKQHGELVQAEMMQWEMEELRRIGAAGNFWFSYTDEWHRGGADVTGWDFGIVTRDRRSKQVCDQLSLNSSFIIRHSSLELSAIVCSRNGAATLRECLAALDRQTHPKFEVLVIDDGSTDATPEIAREFSFVKYHRQDHAGLSAARNLGARLAQGQILAYTDDDCVPDEDWLLNLAAAFDDENCVAAGGPNLAPSPRTNTEAVVAAAPGAPAHVLASDQDAEHLPGCNLAIRKTALEAIGGFRDEFTAAGDDVDVCWRLLAAGGKLFFMPAAVVWHHRRATVAAYLRQQRGYGSAEAQLIKRWPERFAWIGGARWRGAIYGHDPLADLSARLIDFGLGGSALFPTIYASYTRRWSDLYSGLPCAPLVIALLGAGMVYQPLLFLSALLLGGTIISAVSSAYQRSRDGRLKSWRGGLLLALLCWLQPLVRDWARLRGIFNLRAWPCAKSGSKKRSQDVSPLPEQRRDALVAVSNLPSRFGSRVWSFWNRSGEDDAVFIAAFIKVCADAGTNFVNVTGPGNEWDFKLHASGMTAFVTTVTEYHEGGGRMVRVRCSRPQWNRVMNWVSVLPVEIGLLSALLIPGSESARMIRIETGIFIQLGVFVLSAIWDVITTYHFHSLLHRAAKRCGWIEGCLSRASGDSSLAAATNSDKLPEQVP
ncbi:MAG: glycosyltransferase [Verrucomicrobia bacterium]|nr:glycosyltransferase [Verrucomicrobiota bacterium]